jgi:acyl-CoA reductase-like NAD-dependent aldehyde dehydrogenase
MKEMVQIVVASRNPVKLAAVRTVAAALFGEAAVVKPADPPPAALRSRSRTRRRSVLPAIVRCTRRPGRTSEWVWRAG